MHHRALLSAALLAAVVVAAVVVRASDHLDSPYIDQYGARDIGDLFIWTGRQTESPAFLINLNPLTMPSPDSMPGLDPAVLYQFKIDTDDDYVADLAYRIVVEGTVRAPDDVQRVLLLRATGAAADREEATGDTLAAGVSTAFGAATPTIIEGDDGALLFVGPREDPFFFNFKGVESPVALDLRFALSNDGLPTDGTSANTFGPTNITAIVLEVPELKGRAFKAWATTAVDGKQQDRCGKSSVTAVFLPRTPTGRNPHQYPYGTYKQPYNETKPADDLANYGEAFAYRLGQIQVDDSLRPAVVAFYLPDVLSYDPARPIGYPNGRTLEEDAVYWTLKYLNPFMAETDTTLVLPQVNPQPLTTTFPYAAPPLTGASARPSCAWWNLACHLGRLFGR